MSVVGPPIRVMTGALMITPADAAPRTGAATSDPRPKTEQHADNFDRSGKAYAMAAPRLFTTHAGAQRLGTPAEGLAPWQSTKINKPDGATLRITATPARHGPAGIEPLSGDVIGFMASFSDGTPPLYVTGDTVWYDGVAEVARRFRPGVVLLFAGAACTRSPFNLTMNTNDAI